jgi:two-component system chemotaxis response regulator CheB
MTTRGAHEPWWPISVLVVDDSAVVRQALKGILESDPRFRVQLACDPYEAVNVMRRSAPSAIVLDIDMPRMDGLTFLRKLMRQHPLPVVICTDHPERGLTALELGAREVIPKPDWTDSEGAASWGAGLRESLLNAVFPVYPTPKEESRLVTEPRHSADVILPPSAFNPRGAPATRVIAIGASTGGVQAIASLLSGFHDAELPGIVIVQHMPPAFTRAFAERLNKLASIALKVAEAGPNENVRPGTVLVVPGHAHGLVRRSGAGYRIELSEGPPVCRHRPSVEVLFRSTAQAAGPSAVGVLLTGMGDDGAQGLREMFDAGSWTIAQNEATSTVFGMPREAIRRQAARQVLPLEQIAGAILDWSRRERA